MESKFACSGLVEMTLKDKDGHIKEVRSIKNRIVMGGLEMMASLLTDQTIVKPTHIACGTGTTDTDLTMTALEAEVFRVPFDVSPSKREGNVVTFVATFLSGMPDMDNCPITEVGIFNAESGGIMFNRAKFLPVNKAKDDELTIKWVVTVASADDITAENIAKLGL